ncbi:MAG: 30S ribosomal protein S15 [Candidatus Thermoplasmatota archaeon]|nr:30S ribosomal protein S15 [Candidatus Thermoplasmatota archaeon]MCL5438318.1 30S ribosomal protein S15 [Candidatus Thermoplasmatota archaeon]
MARMHSGKKGKSGSHNDYRSDDHEWVSISQDEYRQVATSLRKEGMSASMIGIRLRDQFGLPGSKVIAGKKLTVLLEENGMKPEIPEDLVALIAKYQRTTKHLELNHGDSAAIRGRNLIMAKILRLVRYYKKNNYLSPEWSLSKVL